LKGRKAVSSGVESLSRRAATKIEVAATIGNERTKASLKQLANPSSPTRTIQKVGAVLLLSPDPFTDLPAIAIIGASYLMKKHDPLSVSGMIKEADRTLKEFQSLL
jgi:hypothetical protein